MLGVALRGPEQTRTQTEIKGAAATSAAETSVTTDTIHNEVDYEEDYPTSGPIGTCWSYISFRRVVYIVLKCIHHHICPKYEALY